MAYIYPHPVFVELIQTVSCLWALTPKTGFPAVMGPNWATSIPSYGYLENQNVK